LKHQALQLGQYLRCLLEGQADLLGRQTNDAPPEARHFDGFDLSPTAPHLQLDPPFRDNIPPTEPVNPPGSGRKDQDFSTPRHKTRR
jgi:hypothetical protein